MGSLVEGAIVFHVDQASVSLIHGVIRLLIAYSMSEEGRARFKLGSSRRRKVVRGDT
jgi:hypothetical protein